MIQFLQATIVFVLLTNAASAIAAILLCRYSIEILPRSSRAPPRQSARQ
jgi:hypothetical protein